MREPLVRSLMLAVLVAGWILPPALADSSHLRQTEQSRRVVEAYARMRIEDPQRAWQQFLSPDLIQHNPEIPEGIQAHEKFMADRRAAHPAQYLAPEQYANIIDNILADADLVAIKSRLYTAPQDKGRAFVDIWRVAGGKLVEHWDIIQPIPDSPVNPASMGCGPANSYAEGRKLIDTVAHPTCGAPGAAADRAAALATVKTYLDLGMQPGHEVESVRRFVAEDFVQHSPHIRPGKAGLEAYIGARAASGGNQGRVSTIARIIADGNLVLVHRRVTTPDNPRGIAYADLFRVRNGQVVEHWDVIQPIPPNSVAGRSMVMGPLEPDRQAGPASGNGPR
ncbi:MAG TPA: nuclear transport factor 2 family protein [Steroidobacteraceae bacterium]|nr:nuclear transport factor 2 family protein [Steroidobacteraceae bacterium]